MSKKNLPDGEVVAVNAGLRIPVSELWFTAARAGGPGGQHVNKVCTKVVLHFDVDGSPSLSEGRRRIVREKLAGRINRDGILLLEGGEHRSRTRNKAAVLARFTALLRQALAPRRPRRKTKPSNAAKQRRLSAKKRRSLVKNLRKKV